MSEFPDLVNFHSLFTQLQTRYPASSLQAELVQVHDGSFVVRAVVQVEGAILVSSMAAAGTIEQAEDQARLRVLKLLGLAVGGSIPAPPGYVASASIVNLPPLPEFQSAPPFDPTIAPPDLTPPPELPTVEEFQPPEPEPIVPTAKSRKKSEPPAPKVPEPISDEPIDLTPLFLQIEDEMERIGWTREQGRKHLMRVYNKKSRQQLTDDELMDFLAYLQVHPPAGEALFHE